jgi:hypothetical protein
MSTFQESFKDWVQEFIRKKQLQHYYAQKETRRNLLHVVNTKQDAAKPHHAIVTAEEDEYLVSVLKQPTQNKDSYVEVMVTKNHPLYPRFNDAVAVLNVAGTQTQVEGVGEAFQTGIYHVVLTQEEHKLLAGV